MDMEIVKYNIYIYMDIQNSDTINNNFHIINPINRYLLKLQLKLHSYNTLIPMFGMIIKFI